MHIRKKFAIMATGLFLLLSLASVNVVGTQASVDVVENQAGVETTNNEQQIMLVKSNGDEFPIPKNENTPSCLFYLEPTRLEPNGELTKTFMITNRGSATETVYVRKNIGSKFSVTYLEDSEEVILKRYYDYPANTDLKDSVVHKKVVIAPGETKDIDVTFYLTYEESKEGNHHIKMQLDAKWGERDPNEYTFENHYSLMLHGTNDYSSSKPMFLTYPALLRFFERIPALANLFSLLR